MEWSRRSFQKYVCLWKGDFEQDANNQEYQHNLFRATMSEYSLVTCSSSADGVINFSHENQHRRRREVAPNKYKMLLVSTCISFDARIRNKIVSYLFHCSKREVKFSYIPIPNRTEREEVNSGIKFQKNKQKIFKCQLSFSIQTNVLGGQKFHNGYFYVVAFISSYGQETEN